jgi:hypothetical protein
MALKQLTVSSKKIEDPDQGLGLTKHKACIFCEKMVRMSHDNYKSCTRMSRNRFYCPFCLRNNFHLKSARNVLIFSYRGIIGYYYLKHYRKKVAAKKIYLNQIEDFIDLHQRVGLRNPALSYDPDTYLWYADFNKIGTDSWKAPYEEVMHSIKWTLSCFEISKVMFQTDQDKMWAKYQKAFELFYQQRKRPQGRKMLIPTMRGAGFGDEDFFEMTREFTPNMLNLKH